MDFILSEEHRMLREMVKKFTDKELKPIASKIDKEGYIPRQVIDKAAALGLLGIPFPEKYGGSGLGEMGYVVAMEEVSRGCGSFPVFLGAHISIGAMAIYLDGTDTQKQKYLVPLAKGEKIAAFALTEPNAGSDAAAIETTAVRDGDCYILNGTKCYITNGDIADVISVFAVTDRALGPKGGVSAFIVEKTFKGFSVGKKDEKMGIRGSGSCELIFSNCRVPAENVIGQVGLGFITAMKTLDVGRLGLAAGVMGASKELLDISTKYANQRVQFGGPISNQQAVQFMLADMAIKIYSMESIVYRTAWMCDQGMRFSREAAICKTYCSEGLDRIADNAVQLHGGMGYMADYPIERFYRDSRIHRIFEGSNEIQRIVIARDLIKKGGY